MAEKLSPRQQAALQALLSEACIQDAAERAHLDESTIRRYLKDEAFAAAYEEATSGMLQDAAHQMKSGLSDAVGLLRTTICNSAATMSNRLLAAKLVLDYGLKYVEMADIETRITALEAEIRGNNI